jgi:hypothetical protein
LTKQCRRIKQQEKQPDKSHTFDLHKLKIKKKAQWCKEKNFCKKEA